MKYMDIALEEAREGINNGHGGPFGAVIVRGGEIVGKGHNMVLVSHDPTMHGEVAAIRNACAALGTHRLAGCTLYTTAFPCPMCMGAALWAGIDRIVYGCTPEDTAEIGFKDEDFYKNLENGGGMSLSCEDRDGCLELFGEYRRLNGTRY